MDVRSSSDRTVISALSAASLLDDRVTCFGLSADVQYIARGFRFEAISDLGDAEVLRDFGTDLSGVAVDRLLAAEHGIEGTLFFGDQLDRLR